jgi:hypothetical protein
VAIADFGYSVLDLWFYCFQIFQNGVPDEDFCGNASCALNLISTFLFHN